MREIVKSSINVNRMEMGDTSSINLHALKELFGMMNSTFVIMRRMSNDANTLQLKIINIQNLTTHLNPHPANKAP